MGPFRAQDPLLILRGLEKFERLSPPEEGNAVKAFSNITRLRQGRKSWEGHRITNHDLLMERNATNMTRRDLSVILILDLASAVLMIMRHKKLSKYNDDFFPLSADSNYELLKPLNMKTKDPIEILKQLTMAVDCNISDGGNPTQRGGAFADEYCDDEDRCRQITNHYYLFIANQPKKLNRSFFKHVGLLFAAILRMMEENNLTFIQQILNKQQARPFRDDMTVEEKEQILQRREYPNHRTSIVTCIGYYENTQDENLIKKIRESITKKQCIMNKNAYRVNSELIKTKINIMF